MKMERSIENKKQPYFNLNGVVFLDCIHPIGYPPLSSEMLDKIVHRLASDPQIKKIILFGSYANLGEFPTSESDVDILVIMETASSFSERNLMVSRLIRPRPFPMDILVRTPQEIVNLMDCGDCFFKEIIEKGIVLYDQSPQ